MRILVLGGAGYIGSHTALELVKAGHDTAVQFRERQSFMREISGTLLFWMNCSVQRKSAL